MYFDKNFNSNFAYYFTGLIEGDGTIITPKTERSIKGKLNYPSIQLTFNLKDFPLALLIQKELGFGTISRQKGVNACRLTINNTQGVFTLVFLLNGKMRTSKIYDLWRLIDWLNFKFPASTTIDKKSLDLGCIDQNAWLSGFIDSDGHFSIRATKTNKTLKVECKFVIVQSRVDHNKNDKIAILESIASFLCTTVKKTRENKPKPEYSVRTVNLLGNLKLKNYLDKFPLFSSKYLDYMDWLKVLEFFIKKEKLRDFFEKVIFVKSGINSQRKLFNWDHLKNFYSLEK